MTLLKFISNLVSRRHAGRDGVSLSASTFTDEGESIAAGAQSPEGCIKIEGDDWQQAEFVHQSHFAAIAGEMDAVRNIEENHKTEFGWDDIHLRTSIAEPLAPARIRLPALLGLFPARTDFAGIAFWGDDHRVERGFAFRTEGGLTIYGQRLSGGDGQQLGCICFERCAARRGDSLPAELAALSQFAGEHQLLLVAWGIPLQLEANARKYLEFFEKARQ